MYERCAPLSIQPFLVNQEIRRSEGDVTRKKGTKAMNDSIATQPRNSKSSCEIVSPQDIRSALKDDMSNGEKPSARKKIVVIVISNQTTTQFHFTEGALQTTANNTPLWFEARGDLFTAIENIMIMNGLAFNLTQLNEIRKVNDICTDYEAVFNLNQA